MKRLFTLAIIAMIASLSFAQTSLQTKSSAVKKLEQVVDVQTLNKKAQQMKSLEAVKAEKAALAQQTSSSIMRQASSKSNLKKMETDKTIPGAPVSNRKAPLTKAKASVGPHKAAVVDEHGLIVEAPEGVTKIYRRSGTAYTDNNYSMVYGDQFGVCVTVEDGDDVYIKNPVSRYDSGVWVKGTKQGNTIVVPAMQPVGYDEDFDATLSIRWAALIPSTYGVTITTSDSHKYNDDFIFNIDGDVLTLQGTISYVNAEDEAPYMAVVWDDDNSYTHYGDAETVLTYDPDYVAPSTTLVELPEGAVAESWYLNAVKVDYPRVKNVTASVAFVDNDVYVQGLLDEFPDAWVKGTLDGNTITFDKIQYVGKYGTRDIWFAGVDYDNMELIDAKATLSDDKQTITFANDLLANADADIVYYLEYLQNVSVSVEEKVYEDPIITELTTDLPYYNTFDTEAEQAEVGIYDANEDFSTFAFDVDVSHDGHDGILYYRYNSYNAADDYAVFPGMALKAGNSYKVRMDACSYSSWYTEKFELLAGTEAKAGKLTTVLIPETEAPTDYNTYEVDFTPEADGIYYLAVHAISDADCYYLYVDNFNVKLNDPAAPEAVTDVKATPDQTGALNVEISCTAPKYALSGDELDEVICTLKRDGELVKTANATAGSTVVFTDEVAESGLYKYTIGVTSVDGQHIGENASITAYIGEDIPSDPTNILGADKSGKVLLT